MIQQADKKLIDEFTVELLAKIERDLDKIIFFGSRARGLGKPDSDYDLMLVVNKKDPGLTDKIYEVSTDFCLKNNIDVSLKIYTVEDFQKRTEMSMPFFANIKKTGLEIWNKPKRD
jgi:uncharacterized protein